MADEDTGTATQAAETALSNLMNMGRAKHEKRAKRAGVDITYGGTLEQKVEGDADSDSNSDVDSSDAAPIKAKTFETETPQIEKPLSEKSQEGFKQLRERKKELETDLDTIRQQLKDKDITLEQFKNEKLELENKYKEIEAKYEDARRAKDAVDFKTSEEIEEMYIAPVNREIQTLAGKFKEYGVPEETLKEALSYSTMVELEEFIEENVQSKRLKSLVYETIDRIGELNRARVEAEKAPGESLERIRREKVLAKERERTLTMEALETDLGKAFNEALLFNKAQGDLALPYFLEDPNDKEHNEKIVKPSVERAKQVIETLLQPLKASGIRVTPEWLTFASRLAQAGSVATTELAHRTSILRELHSEREENAKLRKELDTIRSKGNPTPKAGTPNGSSSNSNGSTSATFTGKTSTERLGSFMNSFKSGAA